MEHDEVSEQETKRSRNGVELVRINRHQRAGQKRREREDDDNDSRNIHRCEPDTDPSTTVKARMFRLLSTVKRC